MGMTHTVPCEVTTTNARCGSSQGHEEARPTINSTYSSQMSRRLGLGWHCCPWQNSDNKSCAKAPKTWQCTNWDFLWVPGRWQSYTCNVPSFIVLGAAGWSPRQVHGEQLKLSAGIQSQGLGWGGGGCARLWHLPHVFSPCCSAST